MRRNEDLKYGPGQMDLYDLYLPDEGAFDLVIWFHGGGLENGSRKGARFAEDLTKEGVGVASVEYRMYPDAVFPQYILDCARAVKHIMDEVASKEQVKRVFISGQSAGAYLTMMLMLNKAYLANAGVDRKRITGFISDSAQVTTHFNVLRERGLDSRIERIDEAAPFYFLTPDANVNNLLMIWYENDMPCRPEQNRLFYQSAKRLCPGQNICMKELPGGHCNGSVKRNEKGTYDYNDALLEFIRGLE